jgi:hypothetical protein
MGRPELLNCNWLTPRGRVLLRKIIVTQLLEKFSTFKENERLIPVLTRDGQYSISMP